MTLNENRYETDMIKSQNETDIITKCDRYFITKSNRSLLQNASGYLLQNATILLQNPTALTKFNVYYKLRQYQSYYFLILHYHTIIVISDHQ